MVNYAVILRFHPNLITFCPFDKFVPEILQYLGRLVGYVTSFVVLHLNIDYWTVIRQCDLSDKPYGHNTTLSSFMFLVKHSRKLGFGSKQITLLNLFAKGLVHCPMLLPMSKHTRQFLTCRSAVSLCSLCPLPASSRKVGLSCCPYSTQKLFSVATTFLAGTVRAVSTFCAGSSTVLFAFTFLTDVSYHHYSSLNFLCMSVLGNLDCNICFNLLSVCDFVLEPKFV